MRETSSNAMQYKKVMHGDNMGIYGNLLDMFP